MTVQIYYIGANHLIWYLLSSSLINAVSERLLAAIFCINCLSLSCENTTAAGFPENN